MQLTAAAYFFVERSSCAAINVPIMSHIAQLMKNAQIDSVDPDYNNPRFLVHEGS
jgi:hypothetical protein